MMSRKGGLAKQKDTDHATGEIVVFPGRVDDTAVLVQPERTGALHQTWAPDLLRLHHL